MNNNALIQPINPPGVDYRADCLFIPKSRRLEGECIFSFKNTTRLALKYLLLDRMKGHKPDVSLTMSGQPLTPVSEHGNVDSVLYRLPKPVITGENVEINAVFSLVVPPMPKSNVLPIKKWHPKIKWANPVHSPFDFKIKTPDDIEVIAGCTPGKDSRFHMTEAVDPGIVLIKRRCIIQIRSAGVMINVIPRDGSHDEIKRAENIAGVASEAISFYKQLLGFYPYSVLNVIPGDGTMAGGRPVSAGIIEIHGNAPPGAEPDAYLRFITAHEIAHQYFGEFVVKRSPGWLWIALGLFIDREFAIHENAELKIYKELVEEYKRAVKNCKDTRLEVEPEKPPVMNFNRNRAVLHGKGLAFVLSLKDLIGRDALVSVLKRALTEFKGRVMKTRDFQRLVEEEAGCDMEQFFYEWIHTCRYASYRIENVNRRKEEDGFVFDVAVSSHGMIDVPAPITAIFEDGSTITKFLSNISGGHAVFESNSPLKDVVIDPDGTTPVIDNPPLLSADDLTALVLNQRWGRLMKKSGEYYEKALEVNVRNVHFWNRLGIALYANEDYQMAVRAFARTLAFFEQNKGKSRSAFTAAAMTSRIHRMNNNDEDAERLLEAARLYYSGSRVYIEEIDVCLGMEGDDL